MLCILQTQYTIDASYIQWGQQIEEVQCQKEAEEKDKPKELEHENETEEEDF